jgi:hypothetical protein
MITGIFDRQIESIDSEIAQLQALIEAQAQRQNQLIDLQAVAESALESLSTAVSKINSSEPDAIASLKSAVLTLFDSNSGNDGGDQPEPSPDPDDKPDTAIIVSVASNGSVEADFIDEDSIEYPTLEGQCCHIEQELEFYWERLAKPEGQAWEIACPLDVIPSVVTEDNENKCTHEGETMAYVELVKVSDAITYQKRSASGEIVCTYIGFATKGKAVSWQRFVETMTSAVELRPAKRLERCKWEIKAKGLSITQIQRLSEQDFSKAFKPEATKTEPPAVQPNGFESGDIVIQSLTPSNSYKIEQVMPNGVLDCTNLTTGDRQGLRPSAVELVQKASNETPYLVTSGNYTGLAKQTRQRWEKLGIDPKDLIAEMREKRPPEPEWNAAKYNPLASVGVDADDF